MTAAAVHRWGGATLAATLLGWGLAALLGRPLHPLAPAAAGVGVLCGLGLLRLLGVRQ